MEKILLFGYCCRFCETLFPSFSIQQAGFEQLGWPGMFITIVGIWYKLNSPLFTYTMLNSTFAFYCSVFKFQWHMNWIDWHSSFSCEILHFLGISMTCVWLVTVSVSKRQPTLGWCENGLRMSLPPEWKVKHSKSRNGRVYYYNILTKVTRWEHPLGKGMEPPLPPP